MPRNTDAVNEAVEQFRAYLETLTFLHIDPRLRSKFGLSDVVQRTLVEAYRDLERILVFDADGRKRWLRRALANNLLDEIRRWRGPEHDVGREQPLKDAAEDTSPGERLARQEEGLRLLEALSKLGPRQREALILQKYHGWTLAQIAEHMSCTTGAVAGLHARALARLREILPDGEESHG